MKKNHIDEIQYKLHHVNRALSFEERRLTTLYIDERTAKSALETFDVCDERIEAIENFLKDLKQKSASLRGLANDKMNEDEG